MDAKITNPQTFICTECGSEIEQNTKGVVYSFGESATHLKC